ncbi:unnamed protein product (macronuclear) [Paramecium tetraurelia]|uniref:Transmembrane protein n=1 Tax=Paramecium tetraurelia TaxID=5888 RepID=A0E6R1_PARTE|nr:uncharacterized protein GSPATT00023706001 [Paramecium tetraurelia]CAK90978.1 unnamed protein product [Paramecium tetraurelia]|eukprot:XP_001458375.1 hypothetical protein (macronuclear) [Paramecium tetraurelia strain d4-2]
MGNQMARNQDNVPLAPYNVSENYQPQMGAYGNNQYSINSNYSAANDMANPQYVQHQNVQLHNQQQSTPNQPNMSPIPPIPTQPIQLGIPVIQSLEIGQIPQQAITNDLKDQPFHIKKKEIIKALTIYLIMQLIQNGLSLFICIYLAQIRMDGRFSSIICLISSLCSLVVVISGKYQKFQENPRAIINSILIILFYSSTIISYFYFESKQATSDSYLMGIVYVVLVLQSATNCIVITITILYFVIEQKQVRFEIYFLMLCFGGFIAIMIEIWLLFFVCTAFIFGTLLMVVLQQLMSGRFQLKKNQSFGLCNAIYLGILVPCNIF